MKQIYKGVYKDFKKDHEVIVIQSGVSAVVLCECGDSFSATKMDASKAKILVQELKVWLKVCDWCEKNEWRFPYEAGIHVDLGSGKGLVTRLKAFVATMLKEAERSRYKDAVPQLKRLLKWVEANE